MNQPKRVKEWSEKCNRFLPSLPKDVTLGLTVVIPATWPRRETSRQVGPCCGWSPGRLGCCRLPEAHILWLPKLWEPPRMMCFSIEQLPRSGWPLLVQPHSHSTKRHLMTREAEAILNERTNRNFCLKGKGAETGWGCGEVMRVRGMSLASCINMRLDSPIVNGAHVQALGH